MFYLTNPKQAVYSGRNSTTGGDVWRSLGEQFCHVELAGGSSKYHRAEQRRRITVRLNALGSGEGQTERYREQSLHASGVVSRFLSMLAMQVVENTALMSAGMRTQNMLSVFRREYSENKTQHGTEELQGTQMGMYMSGAQTTRFRSTFMFCSTVSSLKGTYGKLSRILPASSKSREGCVSTRRSQCIMSTLTKLITELRTYRLCLSEIIRSYTMPLGAKA